MRFDDAVKLILKFEGGYVHNPDDPGRETKFGISKRAYPNVNIGLLTEDQAKEIYRMDYWDAVMAEALPEGIRLILFDAAVNHGVSAAVKMLQAAIGMKPTGVMSTSVVVATEHISELQAIDKIAGYRFTRYSSSERWSVFGKGWAKRLLEVSIIAAHLAKN